MFDPTSKDTPRTWATTHPMSTKRAYLGAVAVGGVAYVVGGSTTLDSSGAVSTMEVYYTVNDTWATKASMSTPRWRFGVGVVQELVCAGEPCIWSLFIWL